jgi:sugar phosphate isomerase/epimerase
LKEALGQILPLADELGVTLALEPMHPECAGEWTFLTCLDSTLEMLEQLAHPRLKLAFDTYHLGFDKRVMERLGCLAPHVAIVHLGDGRSPRDREQDRTPLGTGAIPIRELVAGLCSAGYCGYFDVELIGEEIERSNYHDLLRQSKQVVFDLLS